MKILILGAYGVFGARLCEGLAGCAQLELLAGGRSMPKAAALCKRLTGPAASEPVLIDRDHIEAQMLVDLRVNIVIDASGPFQSYGESPYRVVEECLDARVNYLDFADGATFVRGISAFDTRARERGIFVLSGVSSFPVLTAAVVRFLSADMSLVHSICGGIAPSPFAIVGENVIRAIAGYAGQPVDLVRDGRAVKAYALTESMAYTIAPPGRLPLRRTRFSLVEVPDLQELPKLWPALRNVWMGAGPVPEFLHRMLNLLALLVRWRLLRSLTPFSPLFFHAVHLLRWGAHRGGMFVEVKGNTGAGTPVHRSWHLLAEGDDGPYIPCMALQAVVLKVLNGSPPAPGARAATGDLDLDDYTPLFAARTIYAGVRQHGREVEDKSLFEQLLGSAFDFLPETVQALHRSREPLAWSGQAQVQRGTGLFARCIARVAGFPAATESTTVHVRVDPLAKGSAERWQRRFGGQHFASVLSGGKGASQWLLVERFGPLRFQIALIVVGGRLNWVVRGGTLWGIRLPQFLVPGGDSYEFESDGRFHFHVAVVHPLVGLIVRYRGWLAPAAVQP